MCSRTSIYFPSRAFNPDLAYMIYASLRVTTIPSVLLYAAIELCYLLVLIVMIRCRLQSRGFVN